MRTSDIRAGAGLALVLALSSACFGVKYNETDTDKDGLMDFVDSDDDNDGSSDLVELRCGSDPKDLASTPKPPAADDNSEEATACRAALGGACNIQRADGAVAGQFCQVEGKRDNCAAGVWICEQTGLVCRSTNVTAEVCDGLDNDCDGTVDNLTTFVCSTGRFGACATGKLTCSNGVASECVPDVQPSTEICDGIDNDCDGAIDEDVAGVGVECSTGLGGACAKGTQQCAGNTLRCVPAEGTFEVCNGLDDDCDGTPDDSPQGAGSECIDETKRGVCRNGSLACVATAQGAQLRCMTPSPAPAEICNNGLDDDCDGAVDNSDNCTCVDNDGDGYGTGGGCRGPDCNDANESVHPGVADPCNGVDDDCDGATDEDFVPQGCNAQQARGECQKGMQRCTQGRPVCEPGTPVAELCNGLDDNCDGNIDNGMLAAPIGTSCTSTNTGDCSPGTFVCQRGAPACRSNILPNTVAEMCNGLDDDCDNMIDETFSIACGGQTWGQECSSPSACSRGLACATLEVGAASGVCVKKCTSSADCLTGQSCIRTSSRQKICLSLCDPALQNACPAGQVCSEAGICGPALCNAATGSGCPAAAPHCQPQGFCLP